MIGAVPLWAALVFLVALAARVGFVFLADQPLLWTHQYTYFTNALMIAEHPTPLRYIVTSEEWRTWDMHWTIAPLYYVFAAAVLKVSGSSLLALRLVQCVLDALAAVGVAWLGRRVGGRHGVWSGFAYALYWPAIEMSSWTMTENLHTPLLVAGVCLLAREAGAPSRRGALVGGMVLGLSCLVRSVSTGLLGLVALSRLWPEKRRALPAAALILGGGLLVILPWTARNVFIIGDAILIESTAFENIWYANHFVDEARRRKQEQVVHSQPTPAAKRAAALHFALRGIQRNPARMLTKARQSFWHFVRPEGLHTVLLAERSFERWRYRGLLLLDDLPLLLVIPLFSVFLAAGAPSPARRLIGVWTAYYMLMVIVIFHNEIRYRSALVPFAFAGAAGAFAALAQPDQARRWRARVALAFGLAIVAITVWPYVRPARNVLFASRALQPARDALASGDVVSAQRAAETAAALHPESAVPRFAFAHDLVHAGFTGEALATYQAALPLASPADWRATLALPRLLSLAGRADEARDALRRAHRQSWDGDPWLMLEVAWQELPPPRTDTIVVGGDDYGAVRGFLHPRGIDPAIFRHRLEWTRQTDLPTAPYRWSRRHAWLRLVPPDPAAQHEVVLEMGSPAPSPLVAPVVTVRVGDSDPVNVTLGQYVQPYRFRAHTPQGRPLLVRIDSPTWSKAWEPADQGIRVDRMTVTPIR